MPKNTTFPTDNVSSMPGFTGWLAGTNKSSQNQHDPRTLTSGLSPQLTVHEETAPSAGCTGSTAPCWRDDSQLGIIIGSPQWIDADINEIAAKESNSAALIQAYRKNGTNFLSTVKGAFAFAIINLEENSVFLGSDRLGRYPVYYSCSDVGLIFGSSADSVLTLLGETGNIRPQGIFDYVYFHMVPSPASIYQGIDKLQSGSSVLYSGGEVSIKRYWTPRFSETTEKSRELSYKTLKSLLSEAVKESIPSQGKVGAFLSGGLDSSTVTGMLSELSGGTCDAYSIGFSAPGYDEMEYARITAKHFGAKLHEYYVTPEDIVDALPLIATSYDEPFGNSSALPAYFCARMAADDGVDTLLAGDGGDEIFAGNERYAKQKIFEVYQRIPKSPRQKLIEPLTNALPDWIPYSNKARSYIEQANIPLPDRLQTYNFLHQYFPDDVFQANFLGQVDTGRPMELQRSVYDAPDHANSLNRMLFLDWQFTLADNDLRKVGQACALAGVKVAYPMLNDDLVEFSTSIPSKWKLPGFSLRDFYKKSLRQWLPEETLNKSKQGFGLPFGVWMHTHKPLQDMAYESIVELKSRDIFNSSFLENAIKMHREGHAAYFGELIWVLCTFELWMKKRR